MRRTQFPAPPAPPGRPNLVIAGYPGVGKTTAGRAAAGLLGMPFLDLDEMVSMRTGMTVARVFEELGESRFRALEEQLLVDASKLSGCVVATGGGAVLHRGAFSELSRGATVAVLTCASGELERRLADAPERPLLKASGPGGIRDLLALRGPVYGAAGTALDTSGMATGQVAAAVSRRYREQHPDRAAVVQLPTSRADQRVVVGEGVLGRLGDELALLRPGVRRAVVICDLAVAKSHGRAVVASLRTQGLETWELSVPRGEACKRVEIIAALWQAMTHRGVDRHDVVVAVGGGAALDAIGFAAATFARGLPLVSVPTTLLAMADAAVGGKVAINQAGTKNSVGAFHQALLVLADPATLETLPESVRRQGLAEIIKGAVLGSPLLLDLLEGGLDRQPSTVSWLVEQAVRLKGGYVAGDLEDSGLRQSLNLGHTFAHGLEAATGFQLPHGEAVSMGLIAAARLGVRLGVSPEELPERLLTILSAHQLPVAPPPGLDRTMVRRALLGDKKRRAGEAVFVVPRKGGGAELVESIPLDMAVDSLWAPSGGDQVSSASGAGAVTDWDGAR